ncbi:MAG: hypothetical protein WKF94_02835 [Solirubrobacteraceae bacterium]
MSDAGADGALHKRDGKVIEGKDGWLFLANDKNRVLDQHAGLIPFAAPTLRRWQLTLETRAAWVSAIGGRYVFLVPPNAHSVFPEYLPDTVPSGNRRPVQQLAGWLERSRSFARITYPLDHIQASKHEMLPYTPVDSHWTAFGAFLAYEVLAEELGEALPRRVTREDVQFREVKIHGDLANKLDPPRRGPSVVSAMRAPRARVTGDNLVRNNGRIIRFVCDAAPHGTCVVFGDSFGYALLRYLSESFRHLVFTHFARLDWDLVRESRADVVVTAQNERFLRSVPDDWELESAHQVALRRIDEGDVRSADSVRALATKLNWP